ncbi:hypothetical protein COO60DRAFT_522115 [Scenedesmus sp. NREL 46B-D3]|nr:hypothetical protein COO60DRAFT_522115 [Scenedesmus sp. NREL 46B-D3]
MHSAGEGCTYCVPLDLSAPRCGCPVSHCTAGGRVNNLLFLEGASHCGVKLDSSAMRHHVGCWCCAHPVAVVSAAAFKVLLLFQELDADNQSTAAALFIYFACSNVSILLILFSVSLLPCLVVLACLDLQCVSLASAAVFGECRTAFIALASTIHQGCVTAKHAVVKICNTSQQQPYSYCCCFCCSPEAKLVACPHYISCCCFAHHLRLG